MIATRRGRPARFVNTVEHRENVLAEAGFARDIEERVAERVAAELAQVRDLERRDPAARLALERLASELVEDARAVHQVDGALASIQREELSA